MSKFNAQNTKINEKVPLYVKVHEHIFSLLKSGEYKPGDKLPSEHELATSLGVSRGTVRQGLLLLQEDGLIYNHQGKGNFVTEKESHFNGLEQCSFIPYTCCKEKFTNVEMHIKFEPVNEFLREKLKIKPSSIIMTLENFYYIEERVVGVSICFVAHQSIEELDFPLTEVKLINEVLIDYIDHQVTSSQAKLSLVIGKDEIRQRMNLEKNEKIVFIDETMNSPLGIPVIVMRSYLHPDYFELNINRR